MQKKVSFYLPKIIFEYFFLFLLGGSVYYAIEMLYRGYSHWSMFILGAICFILIGFINEVLPWNIYVWVQMGISAVIITVLEFIVGYIVNIKLGWAVWDYSNLPFNIMGQICLPFCIIWFFLSLLPIVVDDFVKYTYFGGQRPYYRITKNWTIEFK